MDNADVFPYHVKAYRITIIVYGSFHELFKNELMQPPIIRIDKQDPFACRILNADVATDAFVVDIGLDHFHAIAACNFCSTICAAVGNDYAFVILKALRDN
jgi:hypothetical protein